LLRPPARRTRGSRPSEDRPECPIAIAEKHRDARDTVARVEAGIGAAGRYWSSDARPDAEIVLTGTPKLSSGLQQLSADAMPANSGEAVADVEVKVSDAEESLHPHGIFRLVCDIAIAHRCRATERWAVRAGEELTDG
jgi:hypothetical protein